PAVAAPGRPPVAGGSTPPVGPPPVPPVGGFGPSWAAGSVPPTPPPVAATPTGSTRPKGRGWIMAGAIVAAAALLTAGFLGRDVVDRRDASSNAAISGTNTSTTNNGPTTPVVPSSGDEPVVAVAKALTPAVVQIQTTEGLGSGVIYDSNGLIVTNAHVVGTAKTVQVNLYDGSKLQGTVEGSDTSSDIAVVKVDAGPKKLTAAKLATAEPVVGTVAVAIGSPFGLSGSVTAGVVSAVDRPVDNNQATVNMIQTDAPINPGNSGGALANRNAEVIGINAEIYSQKGENNGIGFAIPINTAKTVADKLTSGGSLARPLVGVSIKDDPNGAGGALIAEIQSGGAAEKAGLQVGDIVTSVDGSPIATADEFRGKVGTFSPGETITLEVTRNGSTVKVDVTLGSNTGN
ncbi:MAG TPA: trypsin-like peptidase domain-containing protein, partial [Acidimicrobiales bacterium]